MFFFANQYLDASFDNTKLRVCRIMIQAALDSKVSLILEKVLPKDKIDAVIETVLNSIHDVNHLIQLAEEMRARAEQEYILKFGQKAQEIIKKLVQDFKKREKLKVIFPFSFFSHLFQGSLGCPSF